VAVPGLADSAADVAEAITREVPVRDFWLFVISLVVQLGLLVLLYWRWRPLYWIGVAAASINLVVALIQTVANAGPLTLLSLLISIVLLLVLLRIEEDLPWSISGFCVHLTRVCALIRRCMRAGANMPGKRCGRWQPFTFNARQAARPAA